jgi:electron transport complex protein RnfD
MNADNIKENIDIQEAELQEDTLLNVNASPHMHAKDSVSRIMWTVVATLVPATIFGIIHFGIQALLIVLLGVASAIGFEAIMQKARGRKITINDGSAALTGLLLAMCLPPTVPPFVPIVGSFIAIVIAKHSMGGLGHNIFNPAHIGRAALLVSWPILMTKWSTITTAVDVVASATPLNILKNGNYDQLISTYGSKRNLYEALFFGTRNGSIGETCTILLLLGGAFLIYKKYIDWIVPVCMISTVGVLTFVFGPSGFFTGDPIFHMMAGGVILGAFFMATDMVTSPITSKGRVIFAVGAGCITVLIRLIGGYPEGVCYSILLMNAVTPLIDQLVRPKLFGRRIKQHVRAAR